MAWEYLDNLSELIGEPAELIDNNVNWNNMLDLLNNGQYSMPYAGYNAIVSTAESPYFFSGGNSKTYTIDWGLTINWSDSRQGQGAGTFAFTTNVPSPQNPQVMVGYSLAGLLFQGTFRIAVNHDAEEMVIILVRGFTNGPYYTQADCLGQYANHSIRKIMYDFVMGHIQPTYTWHSLQSLTGNGQTVQLVTLNLNAINDGEPISNADLSSFSVLPSNANNVRYLVNLAVAAAASESTNDVTVSYTIPALKKGTYTTVKLYGKIGEYPACDNTDDIVEDLDPTKTTKDILGLTGNSTYYFCIQFVTSDGLKLSSNVESIFIGDPVPEEYRPYIERINGFGFFFKDWPQIHDDRWNIDYYPHYPFNTRSFKSNINNHFEVTSPNVPWIEITATGIVSLYISTANNTYTCSGEWEAYVYYYWANTPNLRVSTGLMNIGSELITGRGQAWGTDINLTDSGTYTETGTSLANLLNKIAKVWRNVNIYVDGVCWSKVN